MFPSASAQSLNCQIADFSLGAHGFPAWARGPGSQEKGPEKPPLTAPIRSRHALPLTQPLPTCLRHNRPDDPREILRACCHASHPSTEVFPIPLLLEFHDTENFSLTFSRYRDIMGA